MPKLQKLDLPQSNVGAPLPMVLADEHKFVFGYLLQDQTVDAACPLVVVTVEGCSIFKFGSPNDEALHGHRYSELGLSSYDAYEVLESDWIAELTIANRVHRNHSDARFSTLRHFIWTFHDSTLEFVASGDEPYSVEIGSHDLRKAVFNTFLRVR